MFLRLTMTVQEAPLLGLQVHPGGLVFIFLLKVRISDLQVMLCTETEQSHAIGINLPYAMLPYHSIPYE